MWWLTSRMIADLIEGNNLNDIQNLLEPYSVKERQHILSEKVKGSSLLYQTVQYNQIAIVRYFLDNCGANPNDTGHKMGMESPCLWKAAYLNSMPIAHCLLEHGADIEGRNCYQTTALYIACQYGYYNMVRFLLTHQANVNSSDYNGVTCLMAAVGHPEICEYLLAVGANVNEVTVDGETAVMLAIGDMQIRSVSILLCAGADPRITNDLGENAVFTAALKSLKIRSEYLHRSQEMVTDSVARALEIASCQKIINGDRSLAAKFWQRALKLRSLPSKTPIHHLSTTVSSSSELTPILNLFEDKVAEALLFLESKLGLCHSYSLNLLKGLIFNVESLDGCVTFFRFFICLISTAKNDLFFEMHSHLYDITTLFFLKMSFGFDRWSAILKLLVSHLRNVSNRFQRMSNIQRLSKAKQMNVYFQMVLNIISVLVQKHKRRIQFLYKEISNIVKLDGLIKQDMSLLHFCIHKRYSIKIVSILLSCGANVNARDYEGRTPVHYALESSKYCTREVFGWFFKNGLRFDEITEDNHCLPCLLKRKYILDHPSKYINLQCLAARVVAQVGVTQNIPVARTIQILIYSHS